MSDTPIYDEVRALLAARATEDDLEDEDGPTGCSWCGLPLDDVVDRRSLVVQDPVAGDDILLSACGVEHADQLRRRYSMTRT